MNNTFFFGRKQILAILVTLLSPLAHADFCSILKRGNTVQANECRKNGTAHGVEFNGNWSTMGVNGIDPKTGQRGVWRTASTPPAGGNWEVFGHLGRVFYLNANCFLGKRSFSVANGASAITMNRAENIWITINDTPQVKETWLVDETALVAPANSVLAQGIAKAHKITLSMPIYTAGGKLLRTNTFVYELDGYAQASTMLCK